MKRFFALVLVLIEPGCSTLPPLQTADARISLEKGGCGYIAACPAYAISMTPDGHYRYEGFKNVPILGVREGELPTGSWEKAEAAFANAGWKELADPTTRQGGYPCMPDAPFARIIWRVSTSEEKVFSYNLGCDSEQGSLLLSRLDAILSIPAS